MKLKYLDQLKYRIILSLVIAFGYMIVGGFWRGEFSFSLYTLVTVTVLVFIPLTIIWAIVGTFFLNDEEDKTSDEVIDR